MRLIRLVHLEITQGLGVNAIVGRAGVLPGLQIRIIITIRRSYTVVVILVLVIRRIWRRNFVACPKMDTGHVVRYSLILQPLGRRTSLGVIAGNTIAAPKEARSAIITKDFRHGG